MITRVLLSVLTLVLGPVACAQEPGTPVEVIGIPEPGADGPEQVFTIVERMPEFPGGHEAMFRFIQENLKYPQEERKAGVQGVVYVNFVVGEDGVLNEAKVLRGIGAACDAESLRVVKAMPPWTPGMQRGKPVKVQYNLPIRFKLD
ncbi:MAG: energy transducer TonB [Flavobacteriales bacterium]|nr:energy transducer TonB [Flavobacteriales bacterium]